MKLISKDTAAQEFNKWATQKRLSERVINDLEGAQAIILAAFEEGTLVLIEDFTLTQKLIWPTGEDGNGVAELIYKFRMTVGQRSAAAKGIKPTDAEGRLAAYVAALTDQPRGVINKLDGGDDYSLASSIANYFL